MLGAGIVCGEFGWKYGLSGRGLLGTWSRSYFASVYWPSHSQIVRAAGVSERVARCNDQFEECAIMCRSTWPRIGVTSKLNSPARAPVSMTIS